MYKTITNVFHRVIMSEKTPPPSNHTLIILLAISFFQIFNDKFKKVTEKI